MKRAVFCLQPLYGCSTVVLIKALYPKAPTYLQVFLTKKTTYKTLPREKRNTLYWCSNNIGTPNLAERSGAFWYGRDWYLAKTTAA